MNWIILILALVLGGQAHAYNYCGDAVGCWLFTDTDYNGGDGTTVDDASPNSNTGTFKGAGEPAWSTTDVAFYVSGSAPNSVDFDGSNDYINCGSDASLDDIGSSSVVMWVSADSSGSTSQVLFGRANATELYSGFFLNSYTIRFYVRNTLPGAFISVPSTTTISASTFTHVAYIWDGTSNTSNLKIYKNATEVSYGTKSGGGTRSSDASLNTIIGNAFPLARPVDGKITDVGVFTPALSSTDISAIYDYGLQGQQSTGTYSIIRNSILRNSIIR